MGREILVIRGNITPTIERLEQLAKEREEREKLEREARWAKEREEREAKVAKWKEEHPVLDKYTFISSYNYDTYSFQGDYLNLYFYEWSNIKSNPINFRYSIEFFKFLDRCKIMPTDDNVKKIKCKSGCHVICKPNCTELIIGDTYDEMVKKFSEFNVTANVLATVPTVPKVLSCKIFDSPMNYA